MTRLGGFALCTALSLCVSQVACGTEPKREAIGTESGRKGCGRFLNGEGSSAIVLIAAYNQETQEVEIRMLGDALRGAHIEVIENGSLNVTSMWIPADSCDALRALCARNPKVRRLVRFLDG